MGEIFPANILGAVIYNTSGLTKQNLTNSANVPEFQALRLDGDVRRHIAMLAALSGGKGKQSENRAARTK